MNLNQFDPRSRCFVAAGSVLVVLILLFIVFVEPVLDLNREYNEQIVRDVDRLERYARLAAAAPVMEEELKRLRGGGFAGLYYKDQTAALVGTELQKQLNALVEANRGQVISTQVLRPEKQDHFTRVAIKAQVMTNFQGMQALLKGVAEARPLVFVDGLTVRVRPNRPGPQGEVTEPQLDVSFEVMTYMKEGGA